MLTIRKEQMKLFQDVQKKKFVAEMVEHLRINFPEEIHVMDNASLEKYVEEVFEAANNYDLTSKQDICRFLNLTMFYGFKFENTEDKHWIHQYLTDKEISDPGMRLDNLYNECIYRLEVESDNQKLAKEFEKDQ